MQGLGVDALYINMLEEISYLLNLKATGQHEFDPLFNSSLLLISTGDSYKLKLFIDDSIFSQTSGFFKEKAIQGLDVLSQS